MDSQRFYVELGQRLLQARKSAGLTQKELAERIGMSRAALANMERGDQRMAVHQLVAIAAALGADPAMLLPKAGGLAERVEHAVTEAGLPREVAAWALQATEQLGQDADGSDESR